MTGSRNERKKFSRRYRECSTLGDALRAGTMVPAICRVEYERCSSVRYHGIRERSRLAISQLVRPESRSFEGMVIRICAINVRTTVHDFVIDDHQRRGRSFILIDFIDDIRRLRRKRDGIYTGDEAKVIVERTMSG